MYEVTANTANVWGGVLLLILTVYHRVQTTEYAPVLVYRQHVLCKYYMR